MSRARAGRRGLDAGGTVRLAAFGLAVALVAAACGSTQAGSPTTVLRVVMTDDWVTPPFIDAVREFERLHPDVQVTIEKGPISRMSDLVRAGGSAGTPPDVVQGHATTGAGQGLAQPLDDLWARHRLEPAEFLPGAVEDVTWAGRRYGMPLDSNAMALLYNVDLFEAAGVAPPGPNTTFGDFEQIARRLATADSTRRAIAVPIDSWVTYGWIRAGGGELLTVDLDGRPRFSLDSAPVVETLSFLDRLVEERLAFGPAGPDSRSVDAYALFKSGATAMYATGSWDLVKIMKDVPEGRFAVAPLPRGASGTTRGTVMGGSSLWIPVGSQHRDLAFEFMNLLGSDSYALRFAISEGRLPVRPRLLDDQFFQQDRLKVFVEQLDSAHPSILGTQSEGSKAFTEALTRVLRQQSDPGLALTEAQARAAASVGRP